MASRDRGQPISGTEFRSQDTLTDVGRTQKLRPWSRASGSSRGSGGAARTLTVADIMSKPVRSVAPQALLRDVATLMRTENVGAVPVADEEGHLAGMITDRDIVVRGCARAVPLAEMAAMDVMSTRISVAHPRDSIHRALTIMAHGHVRRLPVVDDHARLVGMLSVGDIAAKTQGDPDLYDAFVRMSGHRSFWHLP